MSEVVRNYTWGGNPRRRRRDLRRRTTGIAKIMVPIALLLLVWGFWLTRDNYDREAFIPADAQIEVYVQDIVAWKAKLAASRLESLAPESSEAQRILNSITGELPVPEWIVNNMSSDLFHLYCPGVNRLDEMVATTHMTRIGCIVERIMRFSSTVQEEFAGGLHLRYVPDAKVYYAVRGRVLLFSFSRDQLIRALTLRSEAAVTPDQFLDGAQKSGSADVFCVFDADAVDTDVKPFERLEVALRFDPDSILAALNGTLSVAFIEAYAPFLGGITPQRLAAPFDGMMTASMNFGMPVRNILESMDDSLPALKGFNDFINPDTEAADTAGVVNDITILLREALRITGTKTRLVWTGMDNYEMLPAPLIAAGFDAEPDAILALFERIVPSTAIIEDIDLTLRLDEDQLLAYSPVIGGASIEPAIASYGSGLIFSSSALMGRQLLQSPAVNQPYTQEGNFYLSIKPFPVVTACKDAAREFAISGLLRGHTEESLEIAAQPFVDAASQIDAIALFISCNQGIAQINMKFDMAAREATQTPAATEEGGANGQE